MKKLEGYSLLHEGSIALAQVEMNGFKIDVPYLEKAIEKTNKKIRFLINDLKKDTVYIAWKKQYKKEMNLDSTQQLGKILFDVLKMECNARTQTGLPKTDEESLHNLDLDFIKDYFKIKKLKKANSTYLKGIHKYVVDGYLHPSFNLHMVQTYRSSSSDPNFQNIPVRDPLFGKLIRSSFIPRKKNRHIVESDFSGVEVHSSTWYHKDPTMLMYLKDKTKDMHRDMARLCYMLKKKELINPTDKKDAKRIKNIRYSGKNGFVFAEFYGDWFMSVAPSLWNNIDELELKTRNGESLKKWLKKKGITKLGNVDYTKEPKKGTFLRHIKEVEYSFWNETFPIYNQWKKDWYDSYLDKGKFSTLSGFTISGNYKKNEVINYPIQGTAFHCLLWSLITLQKKLKKYKMKTLIIGQIHDSIVADVPDFELKDYIELANQIMTIDIKKHWDWIITPLEIEAEVSPKGRSWFEKQKYEI